MKNYLLSMFALLIVGCGNQQPQQTYDEVRQNFNTGTTSKDYNPIILSFLSTGFVLAMVMGADYYFLQYKRKKKVFGKLTRTGIEEVLKFEGFYPQKEEKEGKFEVLMFKSNERFYRIYYDTPEFIIRGGLVTDNGNYQLAQSIACKMATERMAIKIDVIESAEQQRLWVMFSIEILIHYTAELKIGFAKYLYIMNCAIRDFCEEYDYAMERETES